MKMIENGMIINQEKYDKQMKPLPYICESCGEECNNVYIMFSGKRICKDCFDKEIKKRYNEYLNDFIIDFGFQFEYKKYIKGRLING